MKWTHLFLSIALFFIFQGCDLFKPAKQTNTEPPVEIEVDPSEEIEIEKENFFREYVCQGNEPFWNVKIMAEEIIFTQLGEGKVVYPYRAPREVGERKIYQTWLEGAEGKSNLKVTLIRQNCSDSMADKEYEFSVEVVKDGKLYKGCGS